MTRPYHAYLLRLWREESAEYRLTLENAHTRQLTPLPDLQAIVDFLQRQIDNDQPVEKKTIHEGHEEHEGRR